MDAARGLALLRRWWWLLALGALFAVATWSVASRVIGRDEPPSYHASCTLVVSLAPDEPVSGFSEDYSPRFDRLLATYARVITGHTLAERAAADLGGGSTATDVSGRLRADTLGYTQLLNITATGETPGDAESLLAAALRAFDALRPELGLPGHVATYETLPAQRSASDREPLVLTLALVAATGLLCAAGLVLAYEYLADAIRDGHDAALATGLPALAEIGHRRGAGTLAGTDEATMERYRMLRTSVAIETEGKSPQVVLFAAPARACGVSETAAHFALALAQTGRSVALVDADLREPAAHRLFGVDGRIGLADALTCDDLAVELPGSASLGGLTVVAAGARPENPSELLNSARFDEVLSELRDAFDTIVIDSPPVLEVTDATVLALRADAVVLVVRADRTPKAAAAAAVEMLSRTPARMLGVVVSDIPAGWPGLSASWRAATQARAAEVTAR